MTSAPTHAGQVSYDSDAALPRVLPGDTAPDGDANGKTDCCDDRALPLLRIAGVLVVLSQLATAIPDLLAHPATARYVVFFYAVNVSVGLAFFALPATRWMRLWRPVAIALCACLLASVAAISLVNGELEFLFLTASMAPLAAGAILPWSIFWQDSLFLGSLMAFAVVGRASSLQDLTPALHWICLLTAGAIGHFAALTSERHRADLLQEHRKLEKSESTLLKAVDSIIDPLAITEFPGGRYIKVNEEFLRIAGLRREDVVGKTCFEIGFAPESPAVNTAAAEILQRDGKLRNFEADFRLKDGRRITALLSSVLVELADRPCALTVSRDVTELKQTYRELEAARQAALAASRAKSEFLSSMSHEIRTPMNAILGMADMLAETPLNDQQRRFVETMTSNGNALLYLINGILDLAKVESGRLHLEETDFDLDELIERAAETLSVRAHDKGLELAVRIRPDVPLKVTGDPLRLGQVLINLLGNAIKFTEHGEVVLTVANEPPAPGPGGPTLRFSVHDTGIGIASEHCGEIFQSFTQADSSTTRRYGGSGLGLAIARRLVELMRGRIWVESAVGRGSTFHFAVPLKTAEGPRTGMEEAAELDGVRALVVDDNASVRMIVREILEDREAEVAEAVDRDAASRVLAEAAAAGRPFKLLIVDADMPGMDGSELAGGVRNDSTRDSVAIVLMTARKGVSAGESALAPAVYVSKPARRSELLAAIATVLGTQDSGVVKAPAASQEQAPSERPLRILLAEDSPDNRFLIEAYLRNLPYELDEVENGELAVSRFVEHRGEYDLILMDVQMPVMDGYSAVRMIRRWERDHDRLPTPIVALTASVLEDDIRRSLDAGCTVHLGKPVKRARLLSIVRAVTEKSGPQLNGNRIDGEAEVS